MADSAVAYIYDAIYSGYENGTEYTESECLLEIPHEEMFQYLLLPSCLEILILAFTVQRLSSKKQTCCWRRPGIVVPMDIFEMEDRLSYMATYGSLAYLIFEVVINSKYVISYSGPAGYRVFVIILSVICYGITYFPIFAALHLKNIPGYIVGILQAWMFAGVGLYQTFQCSNIYSPLEQFVAVLTDLPKLICLVCLSIMMPYKFAKYLKDHIRGGNLVFNSETKETHEVQLNKIRESRHGKHVRKNFIPPKPRLRKPREGLKGKIKDILLPIFRKWIYYRNPEFKYSARMLSVVLVCFILYYKMTAELLTYFVYITNSLLSYIVGSLDFLGWEDSVYDTEEIKAAREFLFVLYYIVDALRASTITCTCVEGLLASVLLLHVMSSYRKYLLALHKGDHTHIPKREEKSNASIMVGALRYLGYQVGFGVWAYLIQWLIFFLVAVLIASIVIIYKAGYGDFITNKIKELWPLPVTAIVVNILQILVAKFVFLQDRGAVLGIENRRGLFVVTYFMFFYNSFIGLVSCLLRILKAMIIGTLFLGRLDHSTLPRAFQFFDPGFDAYVGFLHMENAHFHPVLLTFVAILNIKVQPRYKRDNTDDTEKSIGLVDSKQMKKRRAINRWHLAYTLYKNAHLRTLRKHYLAGLHAVLEAEAKARKERKLNAKKRNGKSDPPPPYVDVHEDQILSQNWVKT